MYIYSEQATVYSHIKSSNPFDNRSMTQRFLAIEDYVYFVWVNVTEGALGRK
jgi:hypothetical protein